MDEKWVDEPGENITTTIFLTKGKYPDDHDFTFEEVDDWTTLDEAIFRWNGQKKGRDDDGFQVGSFVFWRKKDNTPYTYLGQVERWRIEQERTDEHPRIVQFYINTDEATGKKCDDTDGKGDCIYQRAAWKWLRVMYPPNRFRGIYFH